MKKTIKSWVFIFLASVVVLLLIFFYSLYRMEKSPPTKGWSRGVTIATIDKSVAKDFTSVKAETLPIPQDNAFITLWETDNTLNYAIYTGKGKVKSSGKAQFKFPEFYSLSAVLKDKRLNIFGVSEKGLEKYIFDYNSNTVTQDGSLEKNVRNITTFEDLVVYSGDDFVRLIDSQGQIKPITDKYAKMLDIAKDKRGIYYILLGIEEDNASVDLNYATYDSKSGDIKLFEGFNIPPARNALVASATIGVFDENISLLTTIRGWETGDTATMKVTFPIGNNSDPVISNIDIGGYNPSPYIVKKSDKELEFLATVKNQMGFNTSYMNLAYFTLHANGEVGKKFLTKTKGISINPHIFELGKDTYLQWEDISGTEKTINFASTNEAIINANNNLAIGDFFRVVVNTLIGAFWGLSFIILMFASIILPTVLVIFIISAVKLTWSESNTGKVLNIAIVVQLISKMLFTLKLSGGITQIKEYLPGMLQNTPSLMLCILITTAIATYCVKRKYSKTPMEKSIVEQYIFFTMIDLILYSLIFFPYFSK